ncbi:MarR family transcriptional regulator [Trinickia terrae]|uniref:MarR family transcriptional regulator n=1 Tax=Trinickia terrae TaxID=2571161 RepID=A0A4U1I420_9BURK|nr:MarR family transcriptional regulator [Trinickia terrae]TKC87927.1 MarR family transcriptional regulator [Trinickia terrae]
MYKLTDSFPYVLNRVGVRMGDLFSRRIASYGVTLPMYRVMAALHEVPDQRLNDLSEMTTIELSTLSRLIGAMERDELVSRSRLENNARTVAINLTDRGEALFAELMPIAQHFEQVAVGGLSAAQLKQLKNMLAGVYQRLDALEQELDTRDAGPSRT